MKKFIKCTCLVLLPVFAFSVWQLGYYSGLHENKIGVEFGPELGLTFEFTSGQTVRSTIERARFIECYDGWRFGLPLSLIALRFAASGIPSDESRIWLKRNPYWSIGRGIGRTIDELVSILTLGGVHHSRWAGEALIGYIFEHRESLQEVKHSGSKLDWLLQPGDWIFLHEPGND